MISFLATIERYSKNKEKTGWSFIVINERLASKLQQGSRKGFRVKGKLDDFAISKASLLPIGEGRYILPINAAFRRGTGKKAGDKIKVHLELDARGLTPSADFISCLKDEPGAYGKYKALSRSHQNYFIKWLEGAKTVPTRAKRITMAVIALAAGQDFGQMLRAHKKNVAG